MQAEWRLGDEVARSLGRALGMPPQIAGTDLSRRWLAWELQAKKRGGFDAGTRRRRRALAKSLKAEPAPETASIIGVKPGTVLAREWAGKTHRVDGAGGGLRLERTELRVAV
jgi:Protein of unknown function (DUF2924)